MLCTCTTINEHTPSPFHLKHTHSPRFVAFDPYNPGVLVLNLSIVPVDRDVERSMLVNFFAGHPLVYDFVGQRRERTVFFTTYLLAQ